MKNTLSKLVFVLCLFAGVSCSQTDQEEVETSTENQTTAETDTTTTTGNDEVPESLMRH